MKTKIDSITTKIIATIDLSGAITFRNCKAIEEIGIQDEFNNYYVAGIDENFIVYANDENHNKIPHFKVGDKLLLLSYCINSDTYGGEIEINGIYDNWKSFKESQSFKNFGYHSQSTIFVRVNDYKVQGWNGL